MINYQRLAMMASTAVVALSTTISPVHAAPAISGGGQREKTAVEGVLINTSINSYPGQLIPPHEMNHGCTGVLVGNEASTGYNYLRTRAVLTAGHCIYAGAYGRSPAHWDIGAPYAPENSVHPSFGLKVVHHVDKLDKRGVAEPYPDWKRWNNVPPSENQGENLKRSNINTLHDIGLICLAEPIATLLPVLDTNTHVYPYNMTDSMRGLHTDVIVLGRINSVDPQFPAGLGQFQELFRTNPVRTVAAIEQSLPDDSPLKIRNEFLVNIPNHGSLLDEGDSGGPVFLAGTHRVVGIASRDFNEAALAEKVVAGFSRLDDPLVAKWLKHEIDQCNNTGSLDRNFK